MIRGRGSHRSSSAEVVSCLVLFRVVFLAILPGLCKMLPIHIDQPTGWHTDSDTTYGTSTDSIDLPVEQIGFHFQHCCSKKLGSLHAASLQQTTLISCAPV